MRLGLHTNGRSNEYEIQDAMKVFLSDLRITFVEEFHVKEVQRRADFLLIKNGLVNVEAKCQDWKTLFEQLKDHATYCDYCFALIPDYCLTPVWFKKKLVEKGYGLLVHNLKKNVITEVLEAHYNKPENKKLRSKILVNIRHQPVENYLI